MKPLKLTISAFGPYLDKTEIDFDMIGSTGIYLITGDTGAGKTTLFEAICYVLYGDTASGKDRNAKMLRNKKADDSTETFVELTFISDGRKYRVLRSPKYELEAKKRARKTGADDKVSPAKNKEHSERFEFQLYSEGRLITNTIEGNSEIVRVIGIEKDNFKKISMIAQGEFMDVIRVKTEERKKILTSVFKTEKYGRLTEKLKEYRDTAKTEKDSLERDISNALRSIECDTESEYYVDIEKIKKLDYTAPAQLEELTGILDSIIEEDNAKEKSVSEKQTLLSERKDKNTEKLTKARDRENKAKQLLAVNEQLKEMEKQLPQLKKREESLRDNPQKAKELGENAKVMESRLSEYDELEKISGELSRLQKETDKNKTNIDSKSAEKSIIEKQTEKNMKLLEELKNIEQEMMTLTDDYNKTVERGKQLRTLERWYDNYISASEKHDSEKKKYAAAQYEYDSVSEEYERLNKAYLDDMAGILARDELRENMPCPVCGSVSHPKPAAIHVNAPTKAQVESAKKKAELRRKIWSDAASSVQAAKRETETAANEVCALIMELFDKEIKSDDTEGINGFRAEFAGHMKSCENKCRELKRKKTETENKFKQKQVIESAVKDSKEKADILNEEINKLTVAVESGKTMIKSKTEQYEDISRKLQFESKKEAQRQVKMLIDKAEKLNNEYKKAKADVDEYDKNIEILKTRQKHFIDDIDKIPDEDMRKLLSEKAAIEKEAMQLSKLREIAVLRKSRNENAQNVIKEKSEQYIRKIEYFKNSEDLYNTAVGKVSGSAKMEIDTYVLSTYFDRVIERANKRLKIMTSGRYTFERSEENKGNSKVGLDLDVLDTDSGKTRPVHSLSGGESFMAALALSLGMSDEIQSKSGGIKLETMFIDEGFGSLDGDHLDSAVSALDDLTKGDCLIGIISHVDKLKELISKRIIINKDSKGKTTAKVEI